MASNTTPIYPRLPLFGSAAPANTSETIVFTCSSAEGALVKGGTLCNTTGSLVRVGVYYNDGSNSRLLGSVGVPANAGNPATGTVDAAAMFPLEAFPGLPRDANGNLNLPLLNTHSIRITADSGIIATLHAMDLAGYVSTSLTIQNPT